MDSELAVSYKATMDEAAETAFRLAEITGDIQRQKWYGLALTPFFFVVMFFILNDTSLQYILGGVLALLWIPCFLFTYKRQTKKLLKKSLIRAYGSDSPVQCEYHLCEEFVKFAQKGQEVSFKWESLRQVNATDTVLELVMEPAAVIRIPQRAFAQDGMLDRWMAFISSRKEYIKT